MKSTKATRLWKWLHQQPEKQTWQQETDIERQKRMDTAYREARDRYYQRDIDE